MQKNEQEYYRLLKICVVTVDKQNLIFLDNELKKSQQYLREASPEAKIEDLARKIEKEEGRNLKVE
jgi:hypothetical protein